MTTDLTIAEMRWQAYRIPFRRDFVTGHGAMRVREGAIVSVTSRAGVTGTGEIAPLPEFGGASLAQCLAALPALRQRLIGLHIHEALTTVRSIGAGIGYFRPPAVRTTAFQGRERPISSQQGRERPIQPIPAPTRYGVEVALLDAQTRAEGISLTAGWSVGNHTPYLSKVAVNAVIGASAMDEAVSAAQRAVASGFGCVKLKVGMLADADAEVARVAAVRAEIGPAIHLRLDANGAWSCEQALDLLKRLAACDIQYIEQPLPAADLAGMAQLRTTQPVPIAADEALTGLASAEHILHLQAADVLVIKPHMVGGWQACCDIAQLARQAGVEYVVTSAIEAGVGVAAALQLAASLSPALECGLATLDLLEDDLIRDPLLVEQGAMQIPDTPGLGVTLDEDALARYTIG
ncbi:MAG: o-succinylbenzoate synthase [Ktedonobacterales bacterium]